MRSHGLVMVRAFLLLAFAAGALAVIRSPGAWAQYYPLPTPPPGASPPPIRPLQLISPFPVVRIVGRLTRRGARIRLLSVRAPASAAILVRCSRRRCRRQSLRLARGLGRPVRFRQFERSLRAGTIIEILVGRRGTIGKFTRFRIRRGRRPARRDLCLRPGDNRGTPCPEP